MGYTYEPQANGVDLASQAVISGYHGTRLREKCPIQKRGDRGGGDKTLLTHSAHRKHPSRTSLVHSRISDCAVCNLFGCKSFQFHLLEPILNKALFLGFVFVSAMSRSSEFKRASF